MSRVSGLRLSLILPLALAACATPQEQCINAATRDQRVLERLIAETQGNIARGYAIEAVTETRLVWVDCTPAPTKKTPDPKPRTCLDDRAYTVDRPKAINLDEERAKLRTMQQKQRELARAAQTAVAQCRALYPEEAR